jgi:hypothetical protein
MKDPALMTASEINRELDRLDARRSRNTDAFIAAGRGEERPSEYLTKDDPLSLEARAIYDRSGALRREIERRYGPGAPSRLPRGFRAARVLVLLVVKNRPAACRFA